MKFFKKILSQTSWNFQETCNHTNLINSEYFGQFEWKMLATIYSLAQKFYTMDLKNVGIFMCTEVYLNQDKKVSRFNFLRGTLMCQLARLEKNVIMVTLGTVYLNGLYCAFCSLNSYFFSSEKYSLDMFFDQFKQKKIFNFFYSNT